MPRYFFHSDDGRTLIAGEGAELPDLGAAKLAAARLAGEILSGEASHFLETEVCRVIVSDDRRVGLYRLEIVAVERPDASMDAGAGGQRPPEWPAGRPRDAREPRLWAPQHPF